jgi:hypothetical protein
LVFLLERKEDGDRGQDRKNTEDLLDGGIDDDQMIVLEADERNSFSMKKQCAEMASNSLKRI